MQAKDILKTARFTLSDPQSKRWSDARLLSLMNEGLADIAKNTTLFIDEVYIELINGLADYDISDIAFKIIRVEYEDKELTKSSFAELDKRNPKWKTVEREKLECWLSDKQREGNFKVYPIPTNSVIDNIDFGGNYGIITGITYSDLQLNIAGTLGDLGAVQEDGFVKVYYVRKHPKITDVLDELLVSDFIGEALTHYICGRAFRDNQDTQNRTLGNEEYMLYTGLVDQYSMEKAKSYTTGYTKTPYNPMG